MIKRHRHTRPNPLHNRQQDWVCSLCQNLNYSFRSSCNRCKIQTKVGNRLQQSNLSQEHSPYILKRGNDRANEEENSLPSSARTASSQVPKLLRTGLKEDGYKSRLFLSPVRSEESLQEVESRSLDKGLDIKPLLIRLKEEGKI